MRLAILVIILKALQGCLYLPYKVTGKEDFTMTEFHLSIITYPNKEELGKAADEYGVSGMRPIHAFAAWNTSEKICIIHVTKVKRQADLEIYGHELFHCMHGNWH